MPCCHDGERSSWKAPGSQPEEALGRLGCCLPAGRNPRIWRSVPARPARCGRGRCQPGWRPEPEPPWRSCLLAPCCLPGAEPLPRPQENGEFVAKRISSSPRSRESAREANPVEPQGLRWDESRGRLRGLCVFPVISCCLQEPFPFLMAQGGLSRRLQCPRLRLRKTEAQKM